MRSPSPPRRQAVTLAWMAVCGLALLAAGARHLRMRGRFTFRREATILSRTGATPRTSEAAILFIDAFGRQIPPGATVALLRPAYEGFQDVENAYMAANGRLPNCRVVPSNVRGTNPPQYLASFEAPMQDARYELVSRPPGGFLYRLR